MKYLSPAYRATNGFMGQTCKLCAKVRERTEISHFQSERSQAEFGHDLCQKCCEVMRKLGKTRQDYRPDETERPKEDEIDMTKCPF